ncbi:hypothetical protein D3C87_1532040 [compost metagenome]
MELSKAIRTAYFTALNGNVTFNSNIVPVFDAFAIPDGATPPYILLSSQTSVQGNLKRCKRYGASILVDIVTSSTDPIGRSDSEDIAEQIENIVNPDSFADLNLNANGYDIGNTSRAGDSDLSDKSGIYYIFRKLITYDHIVTKL